MYFGSLAGFLWEEGAKAGCESGPAMGTVKVRGMRAVKGP